jgi:hypothetical protein
LPFPAEVSPPVTSDTWRSSRRRGPISSDCEVPFGAPSAPGRRTSRASLLRHVVRRADDGVRVDAEVPVEVGRSPDCPSRSRRATRSAGVIMLTIEVSMGYAEAEPPHRCGPTVPPQIDRHSSGTRSRMTLSDEEE